MSAHLDRLNPIPTWGEDMYIDPDRRDADLDKILGTSRTADHASPSQIPPRHRRTTSRVAIAAAVAIGVGVFAVTGHPLLPGSEPPLAGAVTPRVLSGFLDEGSSNLQDIRNLAESKLSSTRPDGRGSSYQAWSLFTRVDGREPSRSAIVPQDITYAVNPDRSGRLVVTIGQATDADSALKKGLNLPLAGTVTRKEQYGPGQAALMYPEALSSDQNVLWTQLSTGHPIAELGSGELFVAIADLYKEQRPTTGVRTALLRLLAAQPDVRNLGVLKDRAGRPGLGLGVTSSQPGGLPARFVIVLDQHTGDLLSYEQILTSSPGKLDVKIPAVIDYDLFK